MNSEKFIAKKGDMVHITPQCKSCQHYEGPMECAKGIRVTADLLTNKYKCRLLTKVR